MLMARWQDGTEALTADPDSDVRLVTRALLDRCYCATKLRNWLYPADKSYK